MKGTNHTMTDSYVISDIFSSGEQFSGITLDSQLRNYEEDSFPCKLADLPEMLEEAEIESPKQIRNDEEVMSDNRNKQQLLSDELITKSLEQNSQDKFIKLTHHQNQQQPPFLEQDFSFGIQCSDDGHLPLQSSHEQILTEEEQQQKQQFVNIQKVLSISDSSMQNRVILVSEPELINEGYITTYKLYRIRTKESNSSTFSTEVLRRFSDFEWLHNELVEKYGGYLIPVLPQKSILTKFNIETQDFTKDRQKNLEFFLNKLVCHPHLHLAPQLKIFLCAQNDVFSIIKGEAESHKSIEQKYSQMINSLRSYFQSQITPIFRNQSNNQQKQKDKDSEFNVNHFEKQLITDKAAIQTTGKQIFGFLEIINDYLKQLEEELTNSHRLNLSLSEYESRSNKESQQISFSAQEREVSSVSTVHICSNPYPSAQNDKDFIDESVLNTKEEQTYLFTRQLLPSIHELYRDSLAAHEALQRRDEIAEAVARDSKRIMELNLVNRKSNNTRDLETDLLQSSLQKNKQKLEDITQILAAEIKQFIQAQQSKLMNSLILFKDIQTECSRKAVQRMNE